ncbi:uncharacterized protein LOC142167115 [Nicotiana tabacum]|uniref:Uncharacterized protein LOC142167115 n=1 Tax=Nicotiana tabacum TaxID=4097 RepID=A0AC58SEH4_TOBAC
MSTCCELCGEGHTRDICPVNPESIYYVGQQGRGSMNQRAQYGNTYNPNWRNHPNFSWGGNQNIRPQANYNHPPQPPQQAEESLTDMVKKLLIDNQKVMDENQQVRFENQQLRTEFRNLERQFGQMANNQNTRPVGALPSNTEKNPQINAVTLRNGRELIGKFIFPVDFIILDYVADELVPIILGRPLLATGDAIIKVREGKVILKVDNEEAVFNIYRAIQLPRHYEDLIMISVVELNELAEEKLLRVLREHKHVAGWTISDIKVNEQNELIPTRNLTGWRICIDYRKLNNATQKDHFPLPFIDQMLDRCEETNMVLNWEKCHFMVREGIVLGHKVSKNGLEVDKDKVEAIEKLPPPISVKGVRSFLGHTGVYRRFIKDFSKNISPLCRLLEKDVLFKFDDACLKAFEELKKKLVSAPIIVAPDWNEPFELMNLIWRSETLKEQRIKWLITYPDFVNYLASREMSSDLEPYAKKKFLRDVRSYVWDEPFLFKSCIDQLMRRCVPESEINVILHECQASPYGGHRAGDKTTAKVLQSGIYWPKGIDFMGLFPSSSGCKYILVAVDFVSKWVEAIALPTNDAKVVVKFVKKHMFTRFGTPRVMISDGGTHFCNKLLDNVLA